MQKIKDFFNKYKNVFCNLLFTVWILCIATLLAILIIVCIQSYIQYQQAKYKQKLQHCMYLFPQNTVEQCEVLINR